MRGLEELRVKESDRLAAMAAGLAACGVAVEIEGDGLIVAGRGRAARRAAAGSPPRSTIASPCPSWCWAWPRSAPVAIDDGAIIDTSFPGFVALMNGLGAQIARGRVIIAVDGPAAAGKGTLGAAARRAFRPRLSRYRPALPRRRRQAAPRRQSPPTTAAATAAARGARPCADLGRSRACARNGVRRGGLRGGGDPGGAGGPARLPARFRRHRRRRQGRGARRARYRHRDLPRRRRQALRHRDAEARAERRHKELQERGIDSIYARVLEDMKERDARDSGRAAAPLKRAADAFVLDTSALDADEAFAAAVRLSS